MDELENIKNVVISETDRPSLKTLIVKNFRGIGSSPVTIDLDKIVVLVGPNNAGKSSILKAYQLVMSEGSGDADLQMEDFPNGVVSEEAIPEIELHTVVFDNAPGERWIDKETHVVRERWQWHAPGKPKRQGFDVTLNDWAESGVPWGAPNVANAYRPKPHRVGAFSDPKLQADAIIKLLTDVIKERVKAVQECGDQKSDYQRLIESIIQMRAQVMEQSNEEIETVEKQVSDLVNEVFPGYIVKFDARVEEDVDKDINLFGKMNAQLLMGPGTDGHLSTIDRQGSGARRTLLWSALRIIAESASTQKVEPKRTGKKTGKNESSAESNLPSFSRPHVLLLDEPELCLHPNAIREACRVLYDLPNTGNWQVMVTTHSPAFIDVSRDNTTIVRVERLNGEVAGTTVFRPSRVQFDDDDRTNLKLLNIFDPYVAEFFFGGRSIIVEGDTEYTAFKHVMALKPAEYKDVHIIRARGKATIVSLIKILNHFGSSYAVLHDSDTLTTSTRFGKEMKNPAWAQNSKIFDAVKAHPGNAKVKLFASITNFEKAYFGQEVESEKPYNAVMQLNNRSETFRTIESLLEALLNDTDPPQGAVKYDSIDELQKFVSEYMGG